MFDNEYTDANDLKIVKNANILLYDGMYDIDEYKAHKGYGHASWMSGVELAKKSNVDLLIITHHDPHHTDTELKDYEYEAKQIYPNTTFARSGDTWAFPYVKDESEIEDYFSFNLANFIKDKYKKYTEKISHCQIKNYYTMYLANLLLGSFAIIMTIFDMFFAKDIPYRTYLLAGVLFLGNVLLLKLNSKLTKFIYYLFLIETLFAVMYLFYISGASPFAFAWLILFPLCGMLVFGRRTATIGCATIVIFLIVFLNSKYGAILISGYDNANNYNIKYPLLFTNFTIICYFVETARNAYARRLNDALNNQEILISNQLQELRDQNYALLEYNAKTQMRNDLLSKTFGKFLPDKLIAEQIDANNTSINSRKEKATLLVSGIRKFRTITATMTPQDTINFLNNYFEKMSAIIHENGGITLEYMGDSILAIFEGDNQSDNALVSAIKMINGLNEVNAYNKENNYPVLYTGIAIHTGEVVLGVVGSENHMKYSVVGNAVNIASSIEHRANENEILLSDTAKQLLKAPIHYKEVYSYSTIGLSKELNTYLVDGIGQPYNLSIDDEEQQ